MTSVVDSEAPPAAGGYMAFAGEEYTEQRLSKGPLLKFQDA